MAESKVTLHIEAKLGNLEKIKQIGDDLKKALGLSDVLADFDKLATKLDAIHTKIKAINESGGAIFGRGTGAPAVRGTGIGGSSGGSNAAASAISAVSSQVSSAGARPLLGGGTKVLGHEAAVGSRYLRQAAEIERIKRESSHLQATKGLISSPDVIDLPESQLLSIGSRDPELLRVADLAKSAIPRASHVRVPTSRGLVRQAKSVHPYVPDTYIPGTHIPGTHIPGTHIPGTHIPSIPRYPDPPPLPTEAAITEMDAQTRLEKTERGVRRARQHAREMAQTRFDYNIPERMARRRATRRSMMGRTLGAGLLGGVVGTASMTRGILNEDPGAVLGGAGGMVGGALGFAMGGLPGGFTGGMIGAALGFGVGGVAGTLTKKAAPAYQLEEQGLSPLAIQMGRGVNLLQEDLFNIAENNYTRTKNKARRQIEKQKGRLPGHKFQRFDFGVEISEDPRTAKMPDAPLGPPATQVASSLRAVRNELGFSVDQQVAMTSKMYGAAMAAPSGFNVNRQRTMMQLQRMGVDAGVTGKMMFSFARGQGAIQQRDTGRFDLTSFANRMLTEGLTIGEQQGFFRQAGRFLGDEFMRTGISGVETTTNVNQFIRPLAKDGGGFRAMQFGFGAVEGGRRIAQTGPQSPLDFALVSALAQETGSGGISPTSLLGAYQALETGKILDPSSEYHTRFKGYLQQLRSTGDPAFATFQMNKALQFAMPGLGLSATENITKMVMEGQPMDAVTKEMRKVSGTDTLGSLGTLGTTESMRRTAKLKDDMLRIGTEMIDSMLVFKEAAEQMAEALKDTAPALSSAYTKIAENAAQMSLE